MLDETTSTTMHKEERKTIKKKEIGHRTEKKVRSKGGLLKKWSTTNKIRIQISNTGKTKLWRVGRFKVVWLALWFIAISVN